MLPTVQSRGCREGSHRSSGTVAVHVRNISITAEAGRVLRRRYDAFRPLPGDTFALLFVAEYFYSDGGVPERRGEAGDAGGGE